MKGEVSEILFDSKIKVEENGKQAVFLNPGREKFVRTRVDGGLVKQMTACDWMVVRCDAEAVLIELKGCDVGHALDQVEATFQFLQQRKLLGSRMAALIVCRNPPRHPGFTTKHQRVKERLKQKFNSPLHVVTGNYEYRMEKVLSYKGPL